MTSNPRSIPLKRYIRVFRSPDLPDTCSNRRPNTKLFKKGDLVIAKCNEDGRKYTAVVQENNGKGSVTVQYVEDETEEEVLLDNMWSQKKKFKKGQKVEAQFPDDKEWYPATIKEMVGSGKYLVEQLGQQRGNAQY